MSTLFHEPEITEEAGGSAWLFYLTGIAWLVFAVLVFQGSYTTVYSVSYLFGVVALIAGVNELLSLGVRTTGWKIVHGVLGALFVGAGIWGLAHPHNAFATLSALIGLFFLFKGIVDLAAAVAAKQRFDLWWFQLAVGILEILLAFWVAGSFEKKAILLVAYVGVMALSRGITELIVAFRLTRAGGGGGRAAAA